MRNYQEEMAGRIDFIQQALEQSRATGLVYGNSGGKDSALAGILCKAACADTVGLIMPCASQRNFGSDKDHALLVAEQFAIETRLLDLTPLQELAIAQLGKVAALTGAAVTNLAPRLRMLSLYAVAASENRLVVGTSNRSEIHVGYFTKWGDGACDLNPIADLLVREVYEFLEFLQAPAEIIDKLPSAGLFEGQTDEAELGISYQALDNYLLDGTATAAEQQLVERYHAATAHKRKLPLLYGSNAASK